MRFLLLSCLVSILACSVQADGEKAGKFDYYVLALSWSPNWCALEGDQRGSPQCDLKEDHGWILHGLWPQFQRGWPAYCPTSQRDPSRQMTRGMVDIMGTAGLAFCQWKKHGRCVGVSASQYYALSRHAYEQITRPAAFRQINVPGRIAASDVEKTFLKANPMLHPDMITITCRKEYIQEARICLGKLLDPVICGRDVVQDCQLENAQFDPVR